MDFSPETTSRRQFIKAAVAIGGASALTACQEREIHANGESQSPTTTDARDSAAHPSGSIDPSSLPERQYAWNDYLVRDNSGNTVLPQHQLLLFLNYTGSGPPTADDRADAEDAFRTLERAYQWGTGTDQGAVINRGLLFTVGYSSSYFDRFDEPLPTEASVPPAAAVSRAVGEDPANAEDHDTLVVLTSDTGSVVLAAEEALFGNLDRVNGVAVDGSIDGVFEVAERRSGFIGRGLPAERIDDDRIPDEAPQAMGFKSGFKDNQATEDRVSITEGPFANGTTQAVSRIQIDIDAWYDNSRSERVHRMFSPVHDPEDVGAVGESLAADSNIDRKTTEKLKKHAEEFGTVGHTQKVARARDDEFEPRILRRSESNATDTAEEGTAALNFTSVQKDVDAFIETRKAMNGDTLDVDEAHNGILSVIETVSRAVFLMPPRRYRALPMPQP